MRKLICLLAVCAIAVVPSCSKQNSLPSFTVAGFADAYHGKTVHEIVGGIEAQAAEMNAAASALITQTEMNTHAGNVLQLWEDVRADLYEYLLEELSPEKCEQLTNDEQQWEQRRDACKAAAGLPALGGSMQPLLESCTASDLTRARVYALAQQLAAVRGEEFAISERIAAELTEADPDLDTVFSAFAGQWVFDQARGAVIGVAPAAESGMILEETDCSWVLWVTGGDVLTDREVYGYTPTSIVFHKGNAWYELRQEYSGGISLHYGTEWDSMDDVLFSEKNIGY